MKSKRNDQIGALLQKAAYLLPKSLRLSMEESMVYAQIQTDDFSKLVGTIVVVLLLASAFGSIAIYHFLGQILYVLVSIPGIFFGGFFLAKSLFAFLADSFSSKIEKVLPDMLLLMAANLRAGMIPESSFLASSKPEFGKMNLLLNNAAVEVHGGKDFRDALVEMSARTSSKYFRDSMRIIAEGMRSGAELHLILENLATNLLQNENIRNDMRAQVRSYSLFIFLAATIAAPLLYGVSSFLIGILDGIGKLSSSSGQLPPSSVGVFSSFSIPQIPASLVLIVALINVIITTTSSALLNGILNTGNAKDGLRYAPVFVAIGIGIFIGVRIGVSIFFATSSVGGGGGGLPAI